MSRPGTVDSDALRTVDAAADASLLVQGSKFIAHLAPVATTADADSILTLRQRRYPDATHHCWAYRLGRPEPLIERSSDAGEPSGTAGRPIADELRRAELENVVCVVTRYFGGTKLGTGGLVRAYAAAARGAIDAATITTRTVVQNVTIDFDFDRTGVVFHTLGQFGVHLVPGAYDSRAHGTAKVPLSKVTTLCQRLAELAPSGVELSLGEREIL
ncbi:MAG: YigZ family protein [Candidatus Zixiibacteriota bacterium]